MTSQKCLACWYVAIPEHSLHTELPSEVLQAVLSVSTQICSPVAGEVKSISRPLNPRHVENHLPSFFVPLLWEFCDPQA